MSLWPLARKFARAALTLFLVGSFVFIVLRVTGDPVRAMMPEDTDPAIIAAMRAEWGLDRPLWEQFVNYWIDVAHGDFGRSLRDGRPAVTIVAERLPDTLKLTLTSFAFVLLVGIPLGIFAALRRGSGLDRAIMTLSVVGFSLPNFFLGILLILIFSIQFGWLPSAGSDRWANLVMPVLTLSTAGAAVVARFIRSSMLEVLSAPYIRAARARGIGWGRLVWTIALPNAAIPTVTVIGFMVGALIGGSIVTETVFAWPGVGRLLINAVAARELAIVQMVVMMIAASMVLANLAVDIAYYFLDPRQRFASGSGENA